MAETSPKASPKKATTKTVAAAKAKSATPAKSVETEVVAPAVEVKEVNEVKPVAAKKPAATKAKSASKTPTAKTTEKAAAKSIVLSDEQRYRMIAEAAYYRAEKNQFKSDPLRDWIDAENDINALLSGEK